MFPCVAREKCARNHCTPRRRRRCVCVAPPFHQTFEYHISQWLRQATAKSHPGIKLPKLPRPPVPMPSAWYCITFFAHLPLAVPPSRAICQGHAVVHGKRLFVGLQRYRRKKEVSRLPFALCATTSNTAQKLQYYSVSKFHARQHTITQEYTRTGTPFQ